MTGLGASPGRFVIRAPTVLRAVRIQGNLAQSSEGSGELSRPLCSRRRSGRELLPCP